MDKLCIIEHTHHFFSPTRQQRDFHQPEIVHNLSQIRDLLVQTMAPETDSGYLESLPPVDLQETWKDSKSTLS